MSYKLIKSSAIPFRNNLRILRQEKRCKSHLRDKYLHKKRNPNKKMSRKQYKSSNFKPIQSNPMSWTSKNDHSIQIYLPYSLPFSDRQIKNKSCFNQFVFQFKIQNLLTHSQPSLLQVCNPLIAIKPQRHMATLRQFSLFDMLQYNNINLDILTQTFNTYFYAQYLIKWPEYCVSLWSSFNTIQAYLMGKVEGNPEKKQWHGHVTAVTVAPQCRKQGLARLLMNYLERVSQQHKGFFVDLFVRASNTVAIQMYQKLGYSIFRTVNKYYSSSIDNSGQDAYDMRKSLSRDITGETSKPTNKRIEPGELEWN